MKMTNGGWTHLSPPPNTIRVPIAQHHFQSEPKVNYPFRCKMSEWLRENCWHSEYEYPDDVSIYPLAVYIDPDLAVIFRLMFS